MTKAALFAAVEQMQPGNHLGDVSAAVQRTVEIEGLSIIRTLVGHGIGRNMHEDPQVPNFGEPGKGPLLEEGTVLAIEPMVNAGGPLVQMGDDGWSVYSQDGSLAAHFEFTVAVTARRPTNPHSVARRARRADLAARAHAFGGGGVPCLDGLVEMSGVTALARRHRRNFLTEVPSCDSGCETIGAWMRNGSQREIAERVERGNAEMRTRFERVEQLWREGEEKRRREWRRSRVGC